MTVGWAYWRLQFEPVGAFMLSAVPETGRRVERVCCCFCFYSCPEFSTLISFQSSNLKCPVRIGWQGMVWIFGTYTMGSIRTERERERESFQTSKSFGKAGPTSRCVWVWRQNAEPVIPRLFGNSTPTTRPN